MAENNTESYLLITTKVDISQQDSINVPANAFQYVTLAQELNLPLAQTIGDHAFLGGTSFEKIDLPSATKIGTGSFKFCTGVK